MHNFRKRQKPIAIAIAIVMLYNWVLPTASYALTGGPSQPEVQSFEPIGTNNMVDASTGDFTYNIPLLDVGGYPVNISYHSGITMDQEASWVGLGWNINPGVINRNMRGIPDDFNGETIDKKYHITPNETYGGSFGSSVAQLFGFSWLSLKYSLGIFYNNYKGVGFEASIIPCIGASDKSKTNLTAGLGLSANSESGIGVSPSLSLSSGTKKKDNTDNDLSQSVSIGSSYNSRTGLQALTFHASADKGTYKGNQWLSDRSIGGANGGSQISFASPTYTPQITMPMNNYAMTFSATLGTEILGDHPNVQIKGYYSEQSLAETESQLPAFGYFYTQNAGSDQRTLLDFNREKDGAYTPNIPDLPLTNFSYDLYSVSGQGIGGMYKPFRSDVPVVYDHAVSDNSLSGSVGAEFGLGAGVHGGVDADVTDVESSSGKWVEGNYAALLLTADAKRNNKPDYEPFYFKNIGEKTADPDGGSNGFFNRIGGFEPEMVALDKSEEDNVKATGFLTPSLKKTPLLPMKDMKRLYRQRRNQNISYLTAKEASIVGLPQNGTSSKQIQSYPITFNYPETTTPIDRYKASSPQISDRKAYHISEITTTREDGARYVYGIPAYNLDQIEATFNVYGNGKDYNKGLVSYSSTDRSDHNNKALDGYYSRNEVPAYAHSYLLTAILSTDYVDLTGNGPTPDDFGSYTKFNYSCTSTPAQPYLWRVPYESYEASFNEGLKLDDKDDKGNYIYGQKELWYLHSIETKNYIAEFTIEQRFDGIGVAGEDGGMGSGKLYKLNCISLYSRADRLYSSSATPIKQVHFTYNYDLCGGVPNNDHNEGKLTLTGIYFTYGNSQKGRLSGYKFQYNNVSTDPYANPSSKAIPYNLKGYDRWGNYMPNTATGPSDKSNADFPYTVQNKANADVYCAAWNLNKITLPSGGEINITYEADDYAYVQDKRAMQMFTVSDLYTGPGLPGSPPPPQLLPIQNGNIMNNTYMFFELPEDYCQQNLPEISNPTATDLQKMKDILKRDIIGDITDNALYFRFAVKLDPNASVGGNAYELVPGYAHLATTGINADPYGILTTKTSNGHYTTAYVNLDLVPLNDAPTLGGSGTNVNPIGRAALQFMRLNMPRMAFGQSDVTGDGVEQVASALYSIKDAVEDLAQGFNQTRANQGYCNDIDISRSVIRLYNPSYKKLGGGARVKDITISDKWNEMGSPAGQSGKTSKEVVYGQHYDYTTTAQLSDGSSAVISSGVASYEPMIGGDENPFRLPLTYNDQANILAPDNEHYIETPLGESFFPSPSVVYSKVTITSYTGDHAYTNNGKVVKEFYTAKDFPTITRSTGMDPAPYKPPALLSFLKLDQRNLLTASEGYVVELNDMHGKPKAEWNYAYNNPDAISGTEYKYKVQADNPTRLDNNVQTIDKQGNIKTEQVGVDVDFVADARESSTETTGGGLQGNADVIILVFFAGVVPAVLPSYYTEEVRFQSMVTTKVINRYGILAETDVHQDKATVATKNEYYDQETGEVLVSSTQNEFENSIYNSTFPAHWISAYDQMGPAYHNEGLILPRINFNNFGDGGLLPGYVNYFAPGDELLLDGDAPVKAWVRSVGSSSISAVDANGNIITGEFKSLKIIRSGRRNQQTTPVFSMTSLDNPVVNNKIGFVDANSSPIRILNASSTEYASHWPTFSGLRSSVPETCDCNPTPELNSLLSFLNGFTAAQLISTNLKLTNVPVDIRKNLLPSDNLYWTGMATSTSFTGYITDDAGNSAMISLNGDFRTFPKNNSIVAVNAGVSGTCPDCPEVTKAFQIKDNSSSATIDGFTTFMAAGKCQKIHADNNMCGLQVDDIVNPYQLGILGDWRKQNSSTFITDRVSGGIKDGYYQTFTPFWKWDNTNALIKNTSGDKFDHWVSPTVVTRYNPMGDELEDKDALGNYSSELFGYNNSLVTAVATNAKYNEIGFDNCEDYLNYNQDPSGCNTAHWSFYLPNFTNEERTNSTSHSGQWSLIVPTGTEFQSTREIYATDNTPHSDNEHSYNTKPEDCLGRFNPYASTDMKYVISAWIKEDYNSSTPPTSYQNASIYVDITPASGPVVTIQCKPSGSIIEGWQRVYKEITIPAGATSIKCRLNAGTAYQNAYFDDLRIHPFNANMKSYVYDPVSMRLSAILDENNYATFYEYDEEGALARVKKETQNGIFTIQEIKASQAKK